VRYFLELCESVKANGIACISSPNSVVRKFSKEKEILAPVFDYLKEVKPIVFFKSLPPPTRNVTDFSLKNADIPEEVKGLDAPFRVFSIENFDGTPLEVGRSGSSADDLISFETLCVVVYEIEPKKYFYLSYNYYPEYNRYGVEPVNTKGAVVEKNIYRLNTERVGFENTRQVIKIGSGKNKETHRIRKIVYVCPKKEYEKQNEKLGKQIDWSHRWLVRGHWRKCEGALGKDREGLHCIPNYTWVVDHVKGPEDKILIADKTRIVKKIGEQIHV